MIPMSTSKPPAQTALDAFDEGCMLPKSGQLPVLACELCGDSSTIIISSDFATLCEGCATSLAKLPASSIPAALVALRVARRIHLSSNRGGPSPR